MKRFSWKTPDGGREGGRERVSGRQVRRHGHDDKDVKIEERGRRGSEGGKEGGFALQGMEEGEGTKEGKEEGKEDLLYRDKEREGGREGGKEGLLTDGSAIGGITDNEDSSTGGKALGHVLVERDGGKLHCKGRLPLDIPALEGGKEEVEGEG